MTTCDLYDLRPSKRTRFSSSEPIPSQIVNQVRIEASEPKQIQIQTLDGSQASDLDPKPKCSNISVPRSPRGLSPPSGQDESSKLCLNHEPCDVVDVQQVPNPTTIDVEDDPPPEPSVEGQVDPNHEDSLTPLTEQDTQERVLATESPEKDLEISHYDIWSDFEAELDDFDTELDPGDQSGPPVQPTRSTSLDPDQDAHPAVFVIETSKPFNLDSSMPSSQPSSTQTLASVTLDNSRTPAKSHEKIIQPVPSFYQTGLNSQNDNPQANLAPSQSQTSSIRPKRTVSSLFTTGAGEPFPIETDQVVPSSSSSSLTGTFKDLGVSSISSLNLDSASEQMDGAQKTTSYHPFELPQVQSENLTQTASTTQKGATPPNTLQNIDQKKSIKPTAGDACPVFGFYTSRGDPMPAPVPESMREALDLCTRNFPPYSKLHRNLPESPSPSHRAKVQKASQILVPPSNPSAGTRSNPTSRNQSPQQDRVPLPDQPDEKISVSCSMANTATAGNPSKSFTGLFSTGRGSPIDIPLNAVERARARLDNFPLSPKAQPLSANGFHSPLKDVSNLRPSDNNLKPSNAVQPSTGSAFRQPEPPIHRLPDSLSSFASRIPSQPTTAASLMSTPVRAFQNDVLLSELPKPSQGPISPPPGPHSITAPIRRISNRMHIGLTPQSSRKLTREKTGPEPRPFVTPFKKNVESLPSTSNQSDTLYTPARDPLPHHHKQDTPLLNSSRRSVMYINPCTGASRQPSSNKLQSVFDLSSRSTRSTPMAVWLASPKGYSARHLLSLAIPESVVFMTCKSAVVWTFNSLTDPFGAIQALDALLESGCLINRSTPKWVANHWGLIVWKFAGMVRWQPDCLSRVWNPRNVVQQLKYRYEREFLYGHRSAIKRILDCDFPSNIPLCLVIVGITQQETHATHTKGFSPSPPLLLELSDGWYRIKAITDSVLTRALKRGTLKVGFKIAIGSLCTEVPTPSKPSAINKVTPHRPDPDNSKRENLNDHDDDVTLFLEGNSTSRAKWHETLGFRMRPWFSSLRSLTHDGGKIPFMDIVLMKILPSMFIDEDGRLGKWGLVEENKLQLAWEKEREKEATNIMLEQEKEFESIHRILDTITSICSTNSSGEPDRNEMKGTDILDEDNTGFDAEDLCDDLVERDDDDEDDGLELIRSLSIPNLTLLRRAVQKRLESFQQLSADRLQRTLNTRVPIRRIRHVQPLKIRDFKLFKHPDPQNRRTAQLLVQDLSQLPNLESLNEGDRYWVQNLQPQRHINWNAKLEKVEISLSTRRDTRWTKIDWNA